MRLFIRSKAKAPEEIQDEHMQIRETISWRCGSKVQVLTKGEVGNGNVQTMSSMSPKAVQRREREYESEIVRESVIKHLVGGSEKWRLTSLPTTCSNPDCLLESQVRDLRRVRDVLGAGD